MSGISSGGVRATARDLLGPALVAAIAFAILISLGVWQVERKAWKEGLIADLRRQADSDPAPLPAAEDWPNLTAPNSEFRRVKLTIAFRDEADALVYTPGSALRVDVKTPGFFVFTPATLPDGRKLVVNRGYVPTETYRERTGAEEIVGYIRFPERSLVSYLVPAHDSSGRTWVMRDHLDMAKVKGWGEVAPFYIDQESPVPTKDFPQPGPLTINLPDNHLGYALTWFGLAAVLAAMFAIWAAGRLRKPG